MSLSCQLTSAVPIQRACGVNVAITAGKEDNAFAHPSHNADEGTA
jgi:hypothetical protein